MTRPYGWRLRDVLEMISGSRRARSLLRVGSLKYAANTLARISVDDETRRALDLAAYHLRLRAITEARGVPDAVDEFEGVSL